MPISVTCPKCDSPLKLKADPAGKKVRCPRCKAVFPVPDEDEEDDDRGQPAKPRRPGSRGEDEEDGRRRSAGGPTSRDDEDEEDAGRRPSRKKWWLIGGGIGAGVLVIGIVVLIIASSGGGGKEEDRTDPDNNPRVRTDVIRELKPGTPRSQVEELLGKGRPTTLGEAEKYVQSSYPPDKAGKRGPPSIYVPAGIRSWYYWQNGSARIYAGFGDRAAGEPVGTSFFAGYHGNQYSFVGGASAREDTNQSAYKKILQDPRWLKGPKVKAALVGEWSGDDSGSYTFTESQMKFTSPSAKRSSAYRFRDDEHIEVRIINPRTLKTETAIFRVLTDEKTLYLAEVQGETVKTMDGPYKR